MRPYLPAIALLLAFTAAPAAAHEARQTSGPDIVETASAAGSFETLLAAAGAAGLVDTLSSDGPFTVFAPTDDAFAALPEGTVESLLEPANRDALRAILTYHVIAGEVPAAKLGSLRSAGTINGQKVGLRIDEGRVRIDEATVLTADLRASNGLIHVIDRVLLPQDKNLVGLAHNSGTFTTLLAAAQAAGLAGTLADGGPFTLFAPTDEAFAALPEGTVDSLLAEEGLGTLRKILTYHVLEGRVYAEGALAAGRAATLADEELSIGVSEGRLRVNDSAIVSADLDATNGVIHVIDQVLLPPDLRATADSTEARMSTAPVGSSADQVIRLAIRRGVPLFNSGDAGACAAIYEVAATSLLGGGYALPSSARGALEAGLREAGRMSNERERAWALRHALDAASMELHKAIAG